MADPDKFRFSIDQGGTFTDIYAEVPGKPGWKVLKILSENPGQYSDAPFEGIRRIMEQATGEPVDPDRIEWVRMGTTVATNTLLERKGARTALVITKGFGDLLQIGKQDRPEIFDLVIEKPRPIFEAVVEVDERIRLGSSENSSKDHRFPKGISAASIEVLKAPDLDQIRKDLQRVRESGIESLAVVLMHAYVFPDHERAIGALAKGLGFSHISLSFEVMQRIKIVDRGQTCCVDAYLTPCLEKYSEKFLSTLKGKATGHFFMQSDGGLVSAESFLGSRAILSGPAGGVVGYALTTYNRETGRPVIGFDMGGTSTDVSRFDGEFEWVHEAETAGVHIQVPQLDIRTVAAGGGSRLFYRNGMFSVGPESAGAHPGPVCYRNGGPLSLTDANLLLGRLIPEYFPKVFGPFEDESLDMDAVREMFDGFILEINRERKKSPMAPEEVALGFIEVANENMARPIKEVSIARGFDIKEHVLACFGGAGGQHACAIARALGISKIFIHRFAGILSAYGMGLADLVIERQESASRVLSKELLPELSKRLDALAESALRELRLQGDYPTEVRRYLNMRYRGSDTVLMVIEPPDKNFQREFQKTYKREFGFEISHRDILVDDLRVRVTGKTSGLKKIAVASGKEPAKPATFNSCYFRGGWRKTPVFLLDRLGAGEIIRGSAIIIHDSSTILIEPACTATVSEFGDVEINVQTLDEVPITGELDPIRLSVFGNRFMSIAEQMGKTLQRNAISTNIKERKDFSCAVFGPEGDLVANAPHLPVHLGAMGEAVRYQFGRHKEDMQPGDVWVSNHPIAGGSHLPDITVITPVIRDGRPIFFVANRGHHADIGGISPGSMPPFSRSLDEEGAYIESFKLIENGTFQEEGISRLLRETRALADNISDLKAQVAANFKGIELLEELVDRYSLKTVQAYMKHIQDNAEQSVRMMVKELTRNNNLGENVVMKAVDHLDDGSAICLQLTLHGKHGTAVFDFNGTALELEGNLNAPRAVTTSAILYCLRCLVQSDIPLNEGCLAPISIILEEGSLLSPSETAAVVGGNVLTSQRITDVIFKAFGACAASQGCMNNLTFGNERFGYYETIGGGAGAGDGWHGQSGVHTHMTNTRITDPEILESRYPVLLREFSIRTGSGGEGKFRGGDGLIRDIEFLEPLNVAILSERRVYAPYGVNGGKEGTKGKNLLIRKDGKEIDLGGKNEFKAEPGDRIRILTPGGGASGPCPERNG